MKTAIIYYSRGGTTRRYAESRAAEMRTHGKDVDVVEVREARNRGTVNAFTVGCFAAMRQKPARLAGPVPDLSGYDAFVLAFPVWASFPAPAFNAVVPHLPSGKQVEIVLIAGGGDAQKCHAKVTEKVQRSGSKVVSCTDIKTSEILGTAAQ